MFKINPGKTDGSVRSQPESIPYHTVDVSGTKVNFPFEPYPLQIDYMAKVLECVSTAKNGLLESPTGTGKTLSLLCSCLAWLEQAKAASQFARLKAAADPSADPGSSNLGLLAPKHKIIYSSRTHSQLSQAMSELGGTTYRYMKVAILGSRDQLCVNRAVMNAQSSREKLHMCQARVKAKTCTYHQNVDKNKDRQELRDNVLMDIEDLHKLGEKYHFCPYYMSREMYQSADVIFMPYNYLLDHKTRKTLDLDLNGAIIIFDEAHNIQKMCEESASVFITTTDLALAIKDIDEALSTMADSPTGFSETDVLSSKDFNETEVVGMKGILLDIESKLTDLMKGKTGHTTSGIYALELFGAIRSSSCLHSLDLIVEHFNGKSEQAMANTNGRGVGKLADFLSILFSEYVQPQDLENLYKVHVIKEEKSEGGKGFLKSRSEQITFNLWCFSPGFSMQQLARLGTRSIILTSGTLSPLGAFQDEIGIPFPVQLENKHIISASQVWCGVVSHGPDGTKLNSSFKSRSDPKYLTSLGHSIINIMKLIPHGVLIFFPSYGLMNSTREFWQNRGIWSRIEAVKPVFMEPQKKEALSNTMRDYYKAISEGRGGCFLAVCRGKVAEGLDFANDNGRAVLITGLPYPPFMDPRVELKRQFLDTELRKATGKSVGSSGGISGQKWYSLEAFRATNQAIGRVIRHSRDHGAIIFLDARFGDAVARQNLSKWLQPFLQPYPQLGAAIKGIAHFFKTDSAIGRMREAHIAEQNKVINASKAAKRPRVEIELEADNQKEQFDTAVVADSYRVEPPSSSSTKSEDSIYASSSCSISFNQSDKYALLSRFAPSSQAEQNPPPKKKKIKIVVKNKFPKAGEEAEKDGDASASAPADSCFKKPLAPLSLASDANVEQDKPSATTASSGKDQPPAKDTPNQMTAKNYVITIKKCMTSAEFTMFKNAMKYYKEKGNFPYLRSVLDATVVKYSFDNPYVLEGFKVFLKKDDLPAYDEFCNSIESKEEFFSNTPRPADKRNWPL